MLALESTLHKAGLQVAFELGNHLEVKSEARKPLGTAKEDSWPANVFGVFVFAPER